MDFLPFPLASMLAGAFITLLCFVLLLNIFGLPANWVLLGLVALWKVVHPGATSMDMWFWIMMVGIAVVGEALEMGMQILKAKRYGSSSSGTFAGMIGAIAGAILRVRCASAVLAGPCWPWPQGISGPNCRPCCPLFILPMPPRRFL